MSASSNRHVVRSALTSCGSLSFESSLRIESFLFSFYMRIASAIVVSTTDVAEKIYIHFEIFQDIIPLCRQDLRSSFAHMRALFMSFDFHKLLSATWTNAIA